MPRARILIVEDEQIVALDIQGTLESCGYTIVGQTHRGDEAIKKAAELHPDLIIMDIGLKGEMDGIEAAKQIRSRFDLPVIFLTAFANLPTIERARKAEPYGYIIKPFEERDLVINIEMALYKHGMERKLSESENKFHNVVEHASDGIILNDSHGNIIEWNPAIEKITGLKRSDVIGRPASEITFLLLPSEKKSEKIKEENEEEWKQAIQDGYINPDRMAEREIENLQGAHRIIQSNGFAIETKHEKLGGVIIRDITENKRAEDALRVAEADYRAIFERAPVGIFRSTVEGQFVKVNQVMAGMYGYASPEEMILNVKSIATQMYTEPMLRKKFTRLLAENGESLDFESLDRRKDGSTFWASMNARAVKNAAGEVLYYEGFVTDITERKQIEESVIKSEQRFRALIENGRDHITLLAVDGTLLWENPSNAHSLGYAPNQFVGRNIFELMHPEDKDWTLNMFAQVTQEPGSKREGVFRLLHSSGSWLWIEATATNLLHEPYVQAIVINYRDITDRKNAEEALSKSEALYRQAIEVAGSVPYYQTYADNSDNVYYDFIGEGIREITGYEPQEFNEGLWDSLTEERTLMNGLATYSFDDAIQQVRSGKFPIWKCEHRIKDRDGKTHWIFEAAVELRDENGISHGSIGTFQDITERKQAEIDILAAKNQLKSTLDAIPDLLFEVGLDGRYHSFHSPQQDLLLASPDAFLGKTVSEIMPNDVAKTVMEAIKIAHEKGQSNGVQFELQVPRGTQWFELSISRKNTDSGEEPRFIVLSRDITDRKLLQQAEHEQRQLAESLRDTSTALNSTLKLDEVLDRVLNNIEKLVACDTAMVLLIEGHAVRKILHRSNTPSKSTNQPQVIGNTVANFINIPILDEIIETGQPCLIPNTQTDSRWRAIPGMSWIRSFISAPIQIRGRVAGLINVISTEPHFFTPQQSERLMAFASQVAIAIENAQLFEQAQYLAMTDPLTEMNNRRYFFGIARTEFERIQRTKRTLSIMMIDIDRFKTINDTHGHIVGDLVLREIAARIKNSVRTVDIVARYGGEEFIVLMPETDLDKACQAAERMRKSVGENPIEEETIIVTATLSIGVAEIDENSKNVDQLIVYADQALLNAKLDGRNRVVGFQKT
jgi:diguanylate cyclase (GGDEF)-like protein/PAS domain S-box-containing protein